MSKEASAEGKAGGIVEALERFFLDIIGTILPGFALIVGICYVTGKPFANISERLFNKNTEYEWALLLGMAYIVGHGIISFGSNIVRKWLDHFYSKDSWLASFILPEKEVSEKLSKDPVFKAFLASLFKQIPALAADPNLVTNSRTWRNMALSIAQENSNLVYRFTFLSLLNLGIATVLLLSGIAWVVLLLIRALGGNVAVTDFNILLIIMFAASPLFLERYYYFARIAFQLPISMALAKLEFQSQETAKTTASATDPSSPKSSAHQRRKAYLAGGFHSKWQDEVIKNVGSWDYFDPRSHGLKNKRAYTAWDLEAIRQSSCLFCYLEATNPGGYALALEVGFAKALGKFIILVDEKSESDEKTARYLEMVHATADVTFKTLSEGIDFLKNLPEVS